MPISDDNPAGEPPVDDLSDLDAIGDPSAEMEKAFTDEEGGDPQPAAAKAELEPTATPEPSAQPATPATPVAPAAPATPAPATSFVERARAANIPLASRTDDAALNELSTFFQRDFPQIRQFAEFGQQMAPYQQEFRQFLADRQNPQATRPSPRQDAAPGARTSAGPGDEWMPLPEFDPNWRRNVEFDENGNAVRSINGGALDLPQRVNAYNQAREQRGQAIVDQFPQLVDQRAEAVAERKAMEVFNRMMAERERSQFVNEAITGNESWMFDLDPATGQRRRDLHGQPLLTQEGRAYQQEVATLAQFGLNDKVLDPAVQHWLALRLIGKLPGPQFQQAQPPAATPAQPTPAPVSPQQKLIDRTRDAATRTPGRGGSATNQNPGQLPPAQNESLKADQMLRDALADVPDEDFEPAFV